MRYLAKHTKIPVPRLYGIGSAGPGPYVVMDYIQCDSLDQFLKDPSERHHAVPNPNISERTLTRAFRGFAKLLLELARPKFTCIGILAGTRSVELSVLKRPLTVDMNELAMSANLPQEVLPETFFKSVREYWTSLASQHLSQLQLQQSNIIEDGIDCRKKFVARLSPHMAKSLDNGLFWLCLAARYSSMFDNVFWTFIYEKYHGPFVSFEDRVKLLGQEDRNKLKTFVKEKMVQEKGILDDNYPTDILLEL